MSLNVDYVSNDAHPHFHLDLAGNALNIYLQGYTNYRILSVVRTHPFVVHPLFQGISHYAIHCNSIGIHIRLLAHSPICLRSNIKKRWAYHHENTVTSLQKYNLAFNAGVNFEYWVKVFVDFLFTVGKNSIHESYSITRFIISDKSSENANCSWHYSVTWLTVSLI